MNSHNDNQTHLQAHSEIVKASIAFLQDDARFQLERPYLYLLPQHSDFPVSNCRFSSDKLTPVIDVRQDSASVDFARDGFEFVKDPLPCKNVAELVTHSAASTPTAVLLQYLDRMRILAQQRTCADESIVFDWRVSPIVHKSAALSLTMCEIRRVSPSDSVDGFQEDKAGRHDFLRPAYKAHAGNYP